MKVNELHLTVEFMGFLITEEQVVEDKS